MVAPLVPLVISGVRIAAPIAAKYVAGKLSKKAAIKASQELAKKAKIKKGDSLSQMLKKSPGMRVLLENNLKAIKKENKIKEAKEILLKRMKGHDAKQKKSFKKGGIVDRNYLKGK